MISQNKDDFTFKNINLNISAHSNFGDAFKYSSGNMPDSGNSKRSEMPTPILYVKDQIEEVIIDESPKLNKKSVSSNSDTEESKTEVIVSKDSSIKKKPMKKSFLHTEKGSDQT